MSPLQAYLYLEPLNYHQVEQQKYEDLLFTTTPQPQFVDDVNQQEQQQFELEPEVDLLNQTRSSVVLSNLTNLEQQTPYAVYQPLKNESDVIEEYVEMIRNERNNNTNNQVDNELLVNKSNRIKAAVFTRYKLTENVVNNFDHYQPRSERKDEPQLYYQQPQQQQQPYLDDQQENAQQYQPNLAQALPIIEVIPGDTRPLEIHFKSATKPIRVVQKMMPAEINQTEVTQSEEKPLKIFHTVNRPIISHLHQIFYPIVRKIQEVSFVARKLQMPILILTML